MAITNKDCKAALVLNNSTFNAVTAHVDTYEANSVTGTNATLNVGTLYSMKPINKNMVTVNITPSQT